MTVAICGNTMCTGWGAHCCHSDTNQCCWYLWYNIWWIWFLVFFTLIFLFSCVGCCVRKRRNRAQNGYVIIQTYETQPVYGSLPNQPVQAYDYRVPPPPYTTK